MGVRGEHSGCIPMLGAILLIGNVANLDGLHFAGWGLLGFAGGSPAATYLSCAAKKGRPKKAAPLSRPFGVPCVTRIDRRLRNSPAARTQTVLAENSCRFCVTRRFRKGDKAPGWQQFPCREVDRGGCVGWPTCVNNDTAKWSPPALHSRL